MAKWYKGKMARWQDGKIVIAVLPFCPFALFAKQSNPKRE
jgi:hypothetical protein